MTCGDGRDWCKGNGIEELAVDFEAIETPDLEDALGEFLVVADDGRVGGTKIEGIPELILRLE